MTYTQTRTASMSSTVTEARVREVMKHIFADITALATRGFTSHESAAKWRNDLTWMLSNEVIYSFELQLEAPGQPVRGFHYDVSDDGSLQEAGRSGGMQLHEFPDGTSASMVVWFKRPLPDEIEAEIKVRNWTSPGAYLKGEKTRDRAYSCDGYGVIRNRVGDW
ncbi:hypothetical protein ATI61_118109 [Archangium gephyra]|uniref:Bacterial HORMA domain-containing protein n=2 Tax=Archangium gephyra TaxID=48 RepID=A0ABX9JN69_9BACT|nr:hypothetical protein [Archangium gephyra]REG22904.1 hypothetical protein ATI61_118109 [Archangium gephyra]